MEKEKLDRINFLSAKKKSEGLTESEQKEQKALREEFLMEFRASFTGIMDNTKIVRPDGTTENLKRK